MLGLLIFASHCLFSPPADWEMANPKMPSRRCLASFIEKKKSGFCSSINLTHEKIDIPISEYLRIVEADCKAKKQKWSYLGQIKTLSRMAELTQIETRSKYGDVRLFQAILVDGEDAFILTASALKKEFGKHATKMESAIRSMQITEDLFSLVKDQKERESLHNAWQKRAEGLESSDFEKRVLEIGAELSPVWQILMMRQ